MKRAGTGQGLVPQVSGLGDFLFRAFMVLGFEARVHGFWGSEFRVSV